MDVSGLKLSPPIPYVIVGVDATWSWALHLAKVCSSTRASKPRGRHEPSLNDTLKCKCEGFKDMSRTQIDGVLGVPRNLRSRYCGIVSTVTMSLLSGI